MSSEEAVAEEEEAPEAPELTGGAALKAAREAIGVSRREVAAALNLPVQTLTAIEEDDRHELPEPVFTRGYVRSYAKLLELDPEPLLAAFDQPAEQRGAAGERQRLTTRQKSIVAVIAVAVLAVALLIGVVTWLVTNGDETAEGDAQQPTVVETPTVPDVSPAEAGGEDAEAAPQPVPDDTTDEAVEETVQEASPEPADTVETAAAAPTEPADAPATASAPVESGERQRLNTGDDTLDIEFGEDSWVEIDATDGRKLFAGLGKKGTALRLVGGAPFRILLGYAPSARLAYNGELVPLGPHTRNNVATLVLGQ